MTPIKPGLDKRVSAAIVKETERIIRTGESMVKNGQKLSRAAIRAIAKELPPRVAAAVLKAAGIEQIQRIVK